MRYSVCPSNEIEQPVDLESAGDLGDYNMPCREGHEEDLWGTVFTSTNRDDENDNPFIGQVPMFLLETNLSTYFKPHIMSIGPVHHGQSELVENTKYKARLKNQFIKNQGCRSEGTLTDNILTNIESFKKCYNQQELLEKFHGNGNLAQMFCEDGCTLIQFIHTRVMEGSHDIAADKIDLMTRDLLLLDNQLPLEVLNLVMEEGEPYQNDEGEPYQNDEGEPYQNDQYQNDEGEPYQNDEGEPYQNYHSVGKQLKEYYEQSICQFVAMINFQIWGMGVKADNESFSTANHLLELIWMNIAKKGKEFCSDHTKATTPEQFRSVKDLQAAGIILEPNNSSSSLRDISFNRGMFFCKLKIPPFRVSEQGKFLVVNLMAFEMHPDFKKDHVVTSYITFLSSLVATKADLIELQEAGILFNYLSNDEEVLKTFQELTSSLRPFHDIFSGTRRQLISYLTDEKNKIKGKWYKAMGTYFKTTWTISGFVSVTFFLILTIIKTVFSIMAYVQRR